MPAIQVLTVHPGHGGPLTCDLTAAIIIVSDRINGQRSYLTG